MNRPPGTPPHERAAEYVPGRTPEQIGKEAGESLGQAIAGGLEPIIMRLVEEIATLKIEQVELRDELHELTITVATLRKPPTVHPPDNG